MSNVVEKFEDAFNNCLEMMINQDHFNVDTDAVELRMGVEHTMNQFLEASRQVDTFFIQKKLILTSGIGVKDSVDELRSELQRKEALLQRQQDKLHTWLNLISRSSGSGHTAQAPPAPVNHPDASSDVS